MGAMIARDVDLSNPASVREFCLVDENECWIWRGTLSNGYARRGQVIVKNEMMACVLGKDLDVGEQVNHICHVKQCVNPAHLYIGTHKENMEDRTNMTVEENNRRVHAARKYRLGVRPVKMPRGEYQPLKSHKLRKRERVEMGREWKAMYDGGMSTLSIAERVCFSRQYVHHLLKEVGTRFRRSGRRGRS